MFEQNLLQSDVMQDTAPFHTINGKVGLTQKKKDAETQLLF